MRHNLTLMLLFIFSKLIIAQQNPQLQFIPASEKYFAALNVYIPGTGDFTQYYVKDGIWVANSHIPKFESIFDLSSQKVHYFFTNNASPHLFVYSTKTGDFAFYFLENNKWALNEFLPIGKLNFSSQNIQMTFTQGNKDKDAFIFANSSSGNEIQILSVTDGIWKRLDYFPENLTN